ncbi:MAG: hypothetical protein KGJ24_01235 [Burkholderiales bacterium]|nr:hypothetical protein [Burkholderiales bacterium]
MALKSWAAVAALAAGLGAVGSAQAALVTGRFDPDFGGALAGTNFAGTATFSIADACLNLLSPGVGAFIYQTYNCGGGSSGSGMNFLGAHVDFTSTTGGLNGSVTFAGDPLGFSSILGMYVKDGQVLGIQSSANPLIGPSTFIQGANFNFYGFYLLFGVTNPVIGADENHFPGPEVVSDNDLDDQPLADLQQTRLFQSGDNCSAKNIAGCSASNSAATTFETPEPGSLALALGALTLGLALRQRVARRVRA